MVHIETDHHDDDEAARSVINALKRAGYDIIDHQVAGDSMSDGAVRGTMNELVMYSDPVLVHAAEPETDATFRRSS